MECLTSKYAAMKLLSFYADPATMQIRKACAEYDLTDGFPYTFYKEVVSKVILYRDTHIEVRLQNGQIV